VYLDDDALANEPNPFMFGGGGIEDDDSFDFVFPAAFFSDRCKSYAGGRSYAADNGGTSALPTPCCCCCCCCRCRRSTVPEVSAPRLVGTTLSEDDDFVRDDDDDDAMLPPRLLSLLLFAAATARRGLLLPTVCSIA
jgi:hypothetical protein